jgi:1,4-dihydroxy-2-naphthoate octaprenyltransferase
MQLIFVSVLCVLFNIRDVEEDARSGTHSLPVLFGIRHAKNFVYISMVLYLIGAFLSGFSTHFLTVSLITFFLTILFTYSSTIERHSFFYGLGVDGLILVQSVIGIFLT